MSMSLAFGFVGDFLSFLGGTILALDAILEERRLQGIRNWQRTIAAPELAGVVLTRTGVKLKSKDDVELSFVRQSAKRAALGAVILALGFACLFISRCTEPVRETPSGLASVALTRL
jgi:hypothetical protein